jgi:hypothetical protein
MKLSTGKELPDNEIATAFLIGFADEDEWHDIGQAIEDALKGTGLTHEEWQELYKKYESFCSELGPIIAQVWKNQGFVFPDGPITVESSVQKSRFEMDCYGNFRITVENHVSTPTTYSGIASLEIGGRKFIAVSDCFKGIIPTETIIEVKTLETESEDATECNLFSPEVPCTHNDSREERMKFVADQAKYHE